MKFTLSWLKDYLETDATLEAIVEGLTAGGLEVESVEDKAAIYAPFKVALVEEATQHPDADRLRVCKVRTQDGIVQVVCGAPNARTGMKAVFAPSGSYIPGLDVTLKKSAIRGVESNGMLVSEREMMLSDEHNGIIDLPQDVEIGTPMAALFGLDDVVIDISVTPNRADCAGVYGIARDLAARGLGKLKPLQNAPVKGGFKSPTAVAITDDGNGCAAFYGRTIRGVKNGPSPDWLQKRLKAVGLRPISALVDITNYMSVGMCRPLHVYDAGKLSGGIHVRRGRAGETFDALNDKAYDVDAGMTVIADDSGVLGLGGIVGGVTSGCDEATVDVFLECAYFDPADIARTGRKLQIISDARYRFERGVDPEFLGDATEIATRMILDLCGGEASDVVVAGRAPVIAKDIVFSPSLTAKLGGIEIPAARQKEILTALGFAVTVQGDRFAVRTPGWRGDIEGAADLVEEVLRIHGYQHITPVSVRAADTGALAAQPADYLRRSAAIRGLAARGMQECVTWSFMAEKLADSFLPKDVEVNTKAITLVNPISADLARMRTSILPNLIQALKRNQDRGHGQAALFEVGPVFFGVDPKDVKEVAAGARHGTAGPRHWSGPDASRPVDAFDAKADAMAAIVACGGPANLMITADAPHWYHPGRSGVIRIGKFALAHFGEIHPAILEDIDIQGPVCAFEVFLDVLPPSKAKGTAKKLLELSPLQPFSRDFAFMLDRGVSAEAVTKAVQGADRNLITEVSVFDVYQGKGMGENEKSVAVTVRIQPREATLKDEDIEALSAKIIKEVEAKTGGRLRA